VTADLLSIGPITVGHGDGRPVLSGLTLPPIAAGTLAILVGPNGAGKTTLLRGIAGLSAAHGHATLGGQDLLGLSPYRRAALVGYMPQALPSGSAFTVYESCLTALDLAGLRGEEAAERVLSVLGRLDALPLATRQVRTLSGGQKQIASLAVTLVRDPAVLLLDEPTSALDLGFQFRVMDHVAAVAAERGTIAIAVLHDLTLACRYADTIVVLANGALVAAGRPASVVTSALLRDIWGVSAEVRIGHDGRPRIQLEGPALARQLTDLP
jgi:iron complex transport system ATP-binding protein